MDRRLSTDASDLERYLAARKFIMDFADRRVIVTDPVEIHRAIIRVAEAIPPFTRIKKAALAEVAAMLKEDGD